MPRYSSPIVGAYHHPPANGILRAAPLSAPLTLLPEPTNPHDQNAIMITLPSTSIPPSNHQKLADELADFGVSLTEFLQETSWHIGYIPRQIAALITLKTPTPGTLYFDLNGKPLVIFELNQSF